MCVYSDKNPNFGKCETFYSEFQKKCHLGELPWRITKNIIKGKVMGSPKFKL
jgi:hypothetical protein